MSLSDDFRTHLAEFARVQARPISDLSLVERMQTEATKWINAVHMQHRRVANPLVDERNRGFAVWRQEIDLHFLLVALTRLHRAVELAARVKELQAGLTIRIAEFDCRIPYLQLLRNVGEHFDDYTVGKGRERNVKRFQLQTWSMGKDAEGQLTWNWLGQELSVAEVYKAAKELYRGFHGDIDAYFAAMRKTRDNENLH